MTVWLQFIGITLVIFFAGAKLSKYGDVISEKTGMGRTWIGLVLMASVTSLPELITGISSVVVFDLPDIAAGDLLGSCMFNLLILAGMDFACGGKPISAQTSRNQLLPAGFGILLLGVVNLSIVANEKIPALGWFGLSSVILFFIYLLAMRLIFKKNQSEPTKNPEEQQYENISKKRAFTMYGINAVVVIAAASFLPKLGDQIAEMTGLGHTFVGSLFIALSTSLPEVAVSFSAIRMGAPNLAVGNLLGSNWFNIAILAVDDFMYSKGPLLSNLTGNHTVSAITAMVLTAVVIIGMTYGGDKKHFRLGWDSITMIVVFFIGTWLVYALR